MTNPLYIEKDRELPLAQDFAALRARDPDWAESAMRSHIHAARAVMQAASDA